MKGPCHDDSRSADRSTRVVECLSDEKCRDVLSTTGTAAKTVKEIAAECEISTSTAYRKVRFLVEADLLREEMTLPRNGTLVSKYACDFDPVTVDLTADGDLRILERTPEAGPQRVRGSGD